MAHTPVDSYICCACFWKKSIKITAMRLTFFHQVVKEMLLLLAAWHNRSQMEGGVKGGGCPQTGSSVPEKTPGLLKESEYTSWSRCQKSPRRPSRQLTRAVRLYVSWRGPHTAGRTEPSSPSSELDLRARCPLQFQASEGGQCWVHPAQSTKRLDSVPQPVRRGRERAPRTLPAEPPRVTSEPSLRGQTCTLECPPPAAEHYQVLPSAWARESDSPAYTASPSSQRFFSELASTCSLWQSDRICEESNSGGSCEASGTARPNKWLPSWWGWASCQSQSNYQLPAPPGRRCVWSSPCCSQQTPHRHQEG